MSNVNKWKKDIQANRQKRADVSYKKYGRKSKSKQQYVQGDLVSSARNRAYGVRMNNTPGYTAEDMDIKAGRSRSNHYKVLKGQNPYEIKYLYDGKKRKVEAGTNAYGEKFDSFYTKKRRLTNQEISNRKETGDIYKSRADKLADKGMRTKYIGADKADPKRTRFGQHLKTFKLDGIETAKNRVRAGMGGKGEYIKGAVKDLIDPFGDIIKMADYVGGIGSGVIAGGMENATQLFEGTAESKPLKYFDKDLIKKNVESSVKASNTTGSGKFLGDFFNEATERSVKRNIEQLKNNKNFTEEHKKKLIEQEKLKLSDGKHKMFRTGTGLLGELAMPGALDLGGKAMKAQAFLAKNAFKSGKDMVKGTGDLATAFIPKASQELIEKGRKHKDMLERAKAYKQYLQDEYIPKFGNKIDERVAQEGFENSKYNPVQKVDNTINHALDRGYDNAMANNGARTEILNELSENPFTPNTVRYLGKLEEARKMSINPSTNIAEEVSRYAEMIDNSSDDVAFAIYDKLRAERPEIYNRLVSDSDMVDDISAPVRQFAPKPSVDFISKKPKDVTSKYEGEYGLNRKLAEMEARSNGYAYNPEKFDVDIAEAMQGKKAKRQALANDKMELEVRKSLNADKLKNKGHNISKAEEENAINDILNMFGEGTNKKKTYDFTERKSLFEDGIKSLSNNIKSKKVDYKELRSTFNKIKGDDVPVKVKKDFINNTFFNGAEVITDKVGKKGFKQLVRSFDELLDVQKVVDDFNKTGFIGEVKLSKATREFLGFKPNEKIPVVGGYLNGKKVADANDFINVLTDSLVRKAGSLTDNRYYHKLQYMADTLGYNNFKKDVETPIKELTQELKKLDKTKASEKMSALDILNRKMEVSAELKRLKEISTKRDKMKKDIMGLGEWDFDNYAFKNRPDIVDQMKLYKNNTNQHKLIENMANTEGYDKAVDKFAKLDKDRKLTFDDMRTQAEHELRASGELNELPPAKAKKAINNLASQMYDEYKADMNDLKTKTHVDSRNASVVIDEKGRRISQSPRVEQENLEGVGELELTAGAKEKVSDEAMRKSHEYKTMKQKEKRIQEWNQKVSKFRKDIGVAEAPINKAKIKLQKGQKLYDLPPVKQSLTSLRKAIESEMEMMFTNPSKYEESKDMFKQVKKDYVNSLRSYGVKDKGYFDKVKALQKDLEDMYTKQGFAKLEKKTPLDKVSNPEREALLKSSEYKPMSEKEIFERKLSATGGSKPKNDPKFSMNLQLLAKRIEDTFEELGNTVHGSLKNTPLEKFEEFDDVDEIEALRKRAHEALNKVDTSKSKPMDYEEMIDDMPTFKPDETYDHINPFDKFNQEDNLRQLKENPPVLEEVEKLSMKPPIDEIENMIERVNRKYPNEGTNKVYTDLDEFNKARDLKNPPPKEIPMKDKPTFEKFKDWFRQNDEPMPYEDNVIYDAYKSWLNSWKKGLTIYNPGWHMQNYFQNKGQNYMGIGGKAFGSQKKARQLLKYIKGEGNKAQDIVTGRNLKKGIAGTTYTPDDLKKIVEENNVLGGFGEDVASSRGIFPPLENAVDKSWIMEKLGTNEETARLHHFLTKLERGASPEEAVKSVNKYLYDYSKESKADKVIKDFVDPFWTFHKNNARMIGQTALENPDRLAKVDKGVRGLKNDVSEEDRTHQQQMDIQLPFGSFKDKKNGDKYDYQYRQSLFPEAKDAIPFEQDEIEAKLNPLIQLALQQSRGEGAFGNKIVDGEAGWNEISKDDREREIIRTLNPIMKPFFDARKKASDHQKKADEGKQSQSTSNIQMLLDWAKYITGNKGNYYRDWE